MTNEVTGIFGSPVPRSSKRSLCRTEAKPLQAESPSGTESIKALSPFRLLRSGATDSVRKSLLVASTTVPWSESGSDGTGDDASSCAPRQRSIQQLVDETLEAVLSTADAAASYDAGIDLSHDSDDNCSSCSQCTATTTASATTVSMESVTVRHSDGSGSSTTRREVRFDLELNQYYDTPILLTSKDIEAAWYHAYEYDRIVRRSFRELQDYERTDRTLGPVCDRIVEECHHVCGDAMPPSRLVKLAMALRPVGTGDKSVVRGLEVEMAPVLRHRRKRHVRTVLDSYRTLQETSCGSLNADLQERMLRSRSLHLSRGFELWARVLAELDSMEASSP